MKNVVEVDDDDKPYLGKRHIHYFIDGRYHDHGRWVWKDLKVGDIIRLFYGSTTYYEITDLYLDKVSMYDLWHIHLKGV